MTSGAIPVRCPTNWAMKPQIRSEVSLLSSYLPWGVKLFGGHGFESRWSPELRWSLFTFIVNYCRKFNNTRRSQNHGSRRIKYFFLIWRNYFGKSRLTTSSEITIHKKKASHFIFHFFLFIATTHTDNTTLDDYLSCATITKLHYTAKPTYRNCTYIAVILLN